VQNVLHRRGHLVDASAHEIRTYDRSTAGFQALGNYIHILHSRIEPQIVRIVIKDDWHTTVDDRGHRVWRRCQNRAVSTASPLALFQRSQIPANLNNSLSLTSKQYGCFDFPDPLPLIERVRKNQTPATFQCIPKRWLDVGSFGSCIDHPCRSSRVISPGWNESPASQRHFPDRFVRIVSPR